MAKPFINPTPKLGDLFRQAKQRFEAQETRLQWNPVVKEQYKAFIRDFEDMGHIGFVPPEEMDNSCEIHYDVPHHADFKGSSTKTKLFGFQ